MVDLFDIRREYTQGRLDETTAADDALTQFHAWFEAQKSLSPDEPTVMTLASCDSSGQPWQRIVLLKSYDEDGFIFFTNYTSNKGQHFAENPKASLHFSWLAQERQVQVQGTVSKISREETEAYFHSRPRESQIGACASKQSQPLENRAVLESIVAEFSEQYEGAEIPVPDHWGGYRLSPTRLEFWQGGAARLHDRLEYIHEEGGWTKVRLNP
jgi:pyridoxamine 5'-phosphate oxidase